MNIRFNNLPKNSRCDVLNAILSHAWLRGMSLFNSNGGDLSAVAHFASHEEARRCYDALHGLEIRGTRINMSLTDDSGPGRSVSCSYDPEEIVAPLDPNMGFLSIDNTNNIGLQQLFDYFSRYGVVVGILIIDCGWTTWIIFRDEAAADRACARGQNQTINGRAISLNKRRNPLASSQSQQQATAVPISKPKLEAVKKSNIFNHIGDPWFACFESIFGSTVDSFFHEDSSDEAKHELLARIFDALPFHFRPPYCPKRM